MIVHDLGFQNFKINTSKELFIDYLYDCAMNRTSKGLVGALKALVFAHPDKETLKKSKILIAIPAIKTEETENMGFQKGASYQKMR